MPETLDSLSPTALLERLKDLLQQLLPFDPREDISKEQRSARMWTQSGDWLRWDAARSELHVTTKAPGMSVVIPLLEPPDEHEASFIEMLLAVFVRDAAIATAQRNPDVWEALSLTRFQRSLIALPHGAGTAVAGWLSALEESLSLTYEGQPARYALVYRRRFDAVDTPYRDSLARSLTRFNEPLDVRDLLLNQKWVRAVVDSERTALLVSKDSDLKAAGLLSLTQLRESKEDRFPFAPHEHLRIIQNHLGKRGLAMAASPRGELTLLLYNGLGFIRRHGRWNLLRANALFDRLNLVVRQPSISQEVVRLVLDLAYEGRGALLCVLDDDKDVERLIPDHVHLSTDEATKHCANLGLRRAMRGLDITLPTDREAILGAATVDGATILSRAGNVIDVACLVASEPDAAASPSPGSRERAARAASRYGVAIKVSADGPIRMFHHEVMVQAIG